MPAIMGQKRKNERGEPHGQPPSLKLIIKAYVPPTFVQRDGVNAYQGP